MGLTIAVLSWGQHKTLINTLESYHFWGLDRLGDERIIYFQEISARDKEIADKYDYKYIGSDTNIGIAAAYKVLVEQSASELFLFLENDWVLLDYSLMEIVLGEKALIDKEADIVRYRSRKNPGEPLWTRQFSGREYDKPVHLLDCLHWRSDEELAVFKEIKPMGSPFKGWYRTDAHYANWTNNPHMAKISFLKEHVLPHLGSGNGEQDLQSWWEQQDFLVVQGSGLFKHHRIG